MDFNIDWGYSLNVVLVGMVVVFAVLVILIAGVYIMGKIFNSVKKDPGSKDDPKSKKESPVPDVASGTDKGISGNVVAAIAAAVACMMGPGKKFAIKQIKRAKESRPAWNAAGIAENTKPFSQS